MRTPHRRRSKTLENLARACDDDSKSESPQTAAHQVHSDQTWNKEIDITSTGLRNPRFANARHISSPFATLQNIVDEKSGSPTLRSGRIEMIFECVINWFDDNRHFAASQRLGGFVLAQHSCGDVRRT